MDDRRFRTSLVSRAIPAGAGRYLHESGHKVKSGGRQVKRILRVDRAVHRDNRDETGLRGAKGEAAASHRAFILVRLIFDPGSGNREPIAVESFSFIGCLPEARVASGSPLSCPFPDRPTP